MVFECHASRPIVACLPADTKSSHNLKQACVRILQALTSKRFDSTVTAMLTPRA